MHSQEELLLTQRTQLSRASARLSLIIVLAGSLLACAVGLGAIVLAHRDFKLRARAEEKIRESEAQLESILDNSPAVIFLKDPQGRYLFVNRRYQGLAGVPLNQIVGKTGFEIFQPDIAQAARQHDLQVLQSGKPLEFEETTLDPDGPHIHLAVKFPLFDAAGKIYALCGVSTDITERKRASEQILQLNAELQRRAGQLENANQELEAFSYSVSHDLRAPVRHIDGFVKIWEKQAGAGLDERGRRYLSIIADSARQMGALIDDLLVFSRMSRVEMRRTKVALSSLVHEAVAAFQPETHGRPIDWTIADLPEVEGDPAMLRQVWINLVANAIKYTRPRMPAKIEVGALDASNGEFVFFVRDNGVGFDMQYANKLFGVFQRLHRADEFEGTGISLANVRRIISRHGGRTWAEGKPDAGATFYFSLPKQPPAQPTD